MQHKQFGFTLIELSIVLIVVGLLLGCAMKGRQLIDMVKVKDLMIDFRNVPTLVNAYKDMFHALPGDDALSTTHLGPSASACAPVAAGKCNPGDGIIDGEWSDTTINSESFVLWQHLRLAGLANGSTDISQGAAYLPTNTVGGIIGVQGTANFSLITKTSTGASLPMSGNYVICSKGILGKFAYQLDTNMDDGNPDTGALRIADPEKFGQSVSLAYLRNNPEMIFTVCMSN